MLNFCLRSLLLWSSRFIGGVRTVLQKTLVLQLMVFVLIAAVLWTADNRSMVWRNSVDMVKNGVSRLPRWRRAVRPVPAGADQNRQQGKGASNASVFSTPTPTTAEPAQQQSSGTGASKPVMPESGKRAAETQTESKRWLTVWNVLSVWAFGLVVWSVVKARRRLVIAFEDRADKQPGEDAAQKTGIDASGLGALVAAELASLSALFSEFEEGRSIQSTPQKMKPIDATFQTESAGEFLQNTISSETKFSLGPLQVPVGLILGLVGRIAQGPRIIGQIHRDGSQRLITVRLVGSLGNRVWILNDPATSQGDSLNWRPAAEVANDLACRLFAELAMDRAVTWQALSQFVAGVRAYRRSLQTPKERKRNLREAEHRLLQAQAEDPGFDLAFYNLGVVYSAQEKLEAACAAFTHAAKKNQQRAGTQYALALIHFNLGVMALGRKEVQPGSQYLSIAVEFCDRALELNPPPEQTTQVLALKGLVFWWRAWLWPAGSGIQFREFRTAGKMVRRAVAKAWRVLCNAELGAGTSGRGKPAALEKARSLASRQLENQSQMLLEVAANTGVAASETDQGLAQSTTNFQSWLSRLLLGFILRGAALLIWAGKKLASPKRIRAIALRVACYSLRQAHSLTPAEVSVLLTLGKTYLQRAKYRKAIPVLRAAVRLSPNSSEAWGLLARAYAVRQRYNEALNAVQNFLSRFSRAATDTLEPVAAALDLIKEPYAAIQTFITAIPQERQTRKETGFLLWFMGSYFRLGYRLAGRELRGLSAVNPQLQGYLAAPDGLKQVLDTFDASRKRTTELAKFPEEVQALRGQGKEGVDQLKTLMKEKAERNFHWEVGEVGHNLALLYLDLNQPAEAAQCLNDTIAHLEQNLPAEIGSRGLYPLLARVWRLQGSESLALALEQAKKGVASDPISSIERTELGWVYWRLVDYSTAQSTWEEVLLLTPDEPQLHLRLGLVHLAQAQNSRERPARRSHIDSATGYLKTALELFEEADSGRNDARWLLSQVYALGGKYGEGVRELRLLERTDYFPVPVEISLADACLSNDDWAEAESRFRHAAANVDQHIEHAPGGVNEVPASPLLFDQVFGTISAWAHLGIASSLAEREIFLAQSLREVESAREKVIKLTDEELKKAWEGNCSFHEGFIQLKRDHVDEALDLLEKALAARVDSGTYCTFANALTRKGELTTDTVLKSELARRAITYYQEALRLDWDGRLEPKINKALSQIQAVTVVPPAAEAKSASGN